MAVTWTALSSEHFCCFLHYFFLISFFCFCHSGKNILGHFKCHFVLQISSELLKHLANECSVWKWSSTPQICLPTSAFEKRARKLDPDLISERSIRTIKDKNME